MNRILVLPVLRAIAAVLVCCYHFIWHEGPDGKFFEDGSLIKEAGYFGIQGVYIFFVISGFIIPYALTQSRYTLSHYFTFLLKRLARLHPPYVMSMLLMGLVTVFYAVWWWKPFLISWDRIIDHILFLVPFTEKPWFNEIYWTLAIEFQYYVVIGLLFPLIVHPKKWVMVSTIVAFLLVGYWVKDHRVFFHFAPVFTTGILVFLWQQKRISTEEALFAGIICVALARYAISPTTGFVSLVTPMIIANSKWHSKVTDFFGEISYSLYLIHGFVGGQMLYFLSPDFPGYYGHVTLLILSVATSQLAAYLFYKLVEVPSMDLSSMIKYKRKEA